MEKKKEDDKKQLSELGEEELIAVMERKIEEDKEDCLEALKAAGGVGGHMANLCIRHCLA